MIFQSLSQISKGQMEDYPVIGIEEWRERAKRNVVSIPLAETHAISEGEKQNIVFAQELSSLSRTHYSWMGLCYY